ncbi:unnamed protein product [Arabis nemorensis]|uniref:Ferredoxin--nitrite reductase, chloroplastic n=1 Tax=Arabis nemorensis TaxID=586526 RepID=A0A565CEN9_9BRAS|nr:unnamed protein product [Arabis nemorensis]
MMLPCLAEVEKRLPNGKLERGSSEDLVKKQWERRDYFGVHPQKQEGLSYVGLHVPVGRLQADDRDELARLADTYGSGELRLTVEQNIIIPNVDSSKTEALLQEPFLKNRSVGKTKLRALKVTEEVERLVAVPKPVRMHWTGCPNTCGQVQVADIGFMGCLTRGDNGKPVKGADVYVGGRIGFG